MAKKRQRKSIDKRQPSLFDLIQEDKQRAESGLAEGSMNISCRLRSEISQGLKNCRMSRFEVAAKMSELVGVEITKSQLDSWTAESKEYHRFPAEYLPAYCAVTGDKEPLKTMARLVHCYILESEEALLAELGRIDQGKRELNQKEKAVRELLAAMNGNAGGRRSHART